MLATHRTPAVSGGGGAGMAWPALVTLTTSTTASASALNLVNQAGGAGLTITLPPANSVPSGTLLGLMVVNPGWFTSNSIAAAAGDHIGSETATTLALGFAQSDYAAILVSNGVDRWYRQDQAVNTTANGVSATGDLFIGSGGSTYLNAYGINGITLNASGGAITFNAGSWVSMGTSLGVVLPRKTTAEITAFVLPPASLQVVNTTENQVWINMGTPAAPAWHSMPTTPVA